MPLLTNLLIIFAVLGIINTCYLILNRIKKKSLICPINGDCNKVVKSKYSHIFYVYNDNLGFIYYLLVLITAIFLFSSKNTLFFMKIISGIALLVSIFLFFIQARVLKSHCFYCSLSNLLNLAIFAIFLVL
ncbi:MAG: vitamin K epoxide reductase family protein [Nanoarchaeota archaeon]